MKHGTIIRLRYCKREDASKPICHSERKGFGYRERRIINNKENRSMLGCKRSACNRTKKSYPHNQKRAIDRKVYNVLRKREKQSTNHFRCTY